MIGRGGLHEHRSWFRRPPALLTNAGSKVEPTAWSSQGDRRSSFAEAWEDVVKCTMVIRDVHKRYAGEHRRYSRVQQ